MEESSRVSDVDFEEAQSDKEDALDFQKLVESMDPIPPSIRPVVDDSPDPRLALKSNSATLKKAWPHVNGVIAALLLAAIIGYSTWMIGGLLWPSVDPQLSNVMFERIKVAREQGEDGTTALKIEGQMTNVSKETIPLPSLMITAESKDGAVIKAWDVPAPQAEIGPESVLRLTLTVEGDIKDAENIRVTFSDGRKHAETSEAPAEEKAEDSADGHAAPVAEDTQKPAESHH